MPNPPIRFNPTATAILAEEGNEEIVTNSMRYYTGNQAWDEPIEPGKYYVAHLCQVYVMTEDQFNAAQGNI